MKSIRLSPKKLDKAADGYFANVKYHEDNPQLPVTTDYLETATLAGLALRRWAAQMREERRKAKADLPNTEARNAATKTNQPTTPNE